MRHAADREAYTAAKSAYVEEVLAKARSTRLGPGTAARPSGR